MSFHQFIGIAISLVAITISLHTKYKQRRKDRLKDLAAKLKSIRRNSERIGEVLENPRSHEDLDLRLYELPREMFACHHETGDEDVSILLTISTGFGEESKELEDRSEIFDRYKNNDRLHLQLKVGNPDQLYASDRQYHMTDPFRYTSYIYEKISKIEEEYGSVIEEFNETLLGDLESHLDAMLKQHTDHLIVKSNIFSMNVNEFESADEIGEAVFRTMFYYNGLEDDLEELDEKLGEVEELRTTVLQTSYS